MVNITDYGEVLSKLIRDVLRGKDHTGTPNSYTTYIHHPSDYESNGDLKDSSQWVDTREYIIVGTLKKQQTGPIVSVTFVANDAIKISGQGATTFDSEGAVWQILIDTTDVKGSERSWRDKLSGQVVETLIKNFTLLFQNTSFMQGELKVTDVSNESLFIKTVQLQTDLTLTTD
jgi:hypothetical protein